MSSQLDTYLENSTRVRTLISIHEAIRSMTTSAVETSDILRAGHVLAVSALDSYVHDTVRTAFMEIYDGYRPPVPGYHRFRVSLGNFTGHGALATARSNIETDIREQHGYLAFQHPDKIADAVRCVSEVRVWEEVATCLGTSAKAVKDRLILIVDRRNKIAHEADIDPTYGALWPVKKNDVIGVIDFLDQVASSIDDIIFPPKRVG